MFELRLGQWGGVSLVRMWRESIPGREKNKWNVSEARICLSHLRNRDTGVTGMQRIRGKVVGEGAYQEGRACLQCSEEKGRCPPSPPPPPTQCQALKAFSSIRHRSRGQCSQSFYFTVLLTIFTRNLYIEPIYQKGSFHIYGLVSCFMDVPSWATLLPKKVKTANQTYLRKSREILQWLSNVRWFKINSLKKVQRTNES